MHRRTFINQCFPTVRADLFRVAVALLFLIEASNVNAQISGNATIVSDYRYRGVSLSQGRSEAQVDVGYDSPNGWYTGMLASGVRLNYADTEQFVAYAGYAGKFLSGLNWEVGASDDRFDKAPGYDYVEEFVGLTSDHFNARIYFSPSYLDQETRSIYAELNAAYSLQEHFQLLAHVGLLHPFAATDGSSSELASRYDGRIGIDAKVADWNAQLAWVALQKKSTPYPYYDDRNPHAVVLSISYSF
jgi:uncharacterized protein (TIGR02001 family)